MTKSVSVLGLGYVGSVTAACLAHKGNRIIGVDINPVKVQALNSGRSPVLEAQVDEFIDEGRQLGTLTATTETKRAVHDSEISIICVGTPSLRNGKLDTSVIERVCRDIGEALREKTTPHLVVLRSTVLPGTAETVVIPTLEGSTGKSADDDFFVCVNPEFLREGSAVVDFLQPSFTVLGGRKPEHLAPLLDLYTWVSSPVFETSLATAEMVKYACNSFHALKVVFANEIGSLCKSLSVDADEVTKIFTADTRLNISPAYLKPGFSFGGSCLPKDVRALMYRAKEVDMNLPLLASILPSNEEHLERAAEMILITNRKRIALLGLSFKSGTDDLRESPQVELVKRLIGEGCEIQIWDPEVALGRLIGSNRQYIEDHIPHIGSLLNDDLYEVLDAAEVIVLATTAVDHEALRARVRDDQVVIDLINLEKAKRPEIAGSYGGICW